MKTLTAAFTMTQPAVSQHLRELREADLVISERVGMEQIYKLTGRPLAAVFDWSGKYKRFFDPAGHAWAFVEDPQENRHKTKVREGKHGR